MSDLAIAISIFAGVFVVLAGYSAARRRRCQECWRPFGIFTGKLCRRCWRVAS